MFFRGTRLLTTTLPRIKFHPTSQISDRPFTTIKSDASNIEELFSKLNKTYQSRLESAKAQITTMDTNQASRVLNIVNSVIDEDQLPVLEIIIKLPSNFINQLYSDLERLHGYRISRKNGGLNLECIKEELEVYEHILSRKIDHYAKSIFPELLKKHEEFASYRPG